MKVTRILAASALVLALGSCNSNDQYSVSAKINGQPWQSTGGVNATEGTYGILVNAYNDVQPTIAFYLKEYDTVGTFSLDSVNNSFAYSNYYVRPNRPGTFSITSYSSGDKNVAGTFQLKAFRTPTDSVVITEGAFDVNYH